MHKYVLWIIFDEILKLKNKLTKWQNAIIYFGLFPWLFYFFPSFTFTTATMHRDTSIKRIFHYVIHMGEKDILNFIIGKRINSSFYGMVSTIDSIWCRCFSFWCVNKRQINDTYTSSWMHLIKSSFFFNFSGKHWWNSHFCIRSTMFHKTRAYSIFISIDANGFHSVYLNQMNFIHLNSINSNWSILQAANRPGKHWVSLQSVFSALQHFHKFDLYFCFFSYS